ncbi:MAG: CotH kinase family protein [Clostridia bacterium]|nr:CotH kinase family protein [Clostridia bacterium]
MKKFYLPIIASFLAAASLLTSCGGSAINIYEAVTTEGFFEEETPKETKLTADDIVYENEKLPQVYITTADGFQVTSKKEYTECSVRIELNDRFAEYVSTYTDDNGGGALLRARGNASYNNPEMKEKNKYSYKLKLDTKANMLGMGESKHWYLINNWRDISAMRHKLAYDFAAVLGLTTTNATWVELYYNDEYRGLYLLTESVRIGEDRVDITDWEEFAEDVATAYAKTNAFTDEETKLLCTSMKENIAWITTQKHSFKLYDVETELDLTSYYDKDSLDLTSGYLIEYCTGMDTDGTKWKTNRGIPVVMDNPYDLSTNPEMYNYVKTLIQDFENAITSPTFHNSKGYHYSEYLNVDSLVDYWMIWNFMRNTEFGSRSLYYHIENGKITFGPVWDFDATLGCIITLTASSGVYDKWVHDAKSMWFTKIFADPWFISQCQERWFSIREAVDDFCNALDIYYEYILDDNLRCLERNGIRTYNVKNPLNGGKSFTPAEDYEYTKKWLKNRIEWIDENFSVVDPNVDGSGFVRSDEIFYTLTNNGAALETDKITVFGAPADFVLSSNATGTLEIELTTTYGSSVSIEGFLNSSQRLGTQSFKRGDVAKYTIDVSSLDLTDGARNVLYFPAFKSNNVIRGVMSIVILISDEGNPTEDQSVIDINGVKYYVTKGDEFLLPEITATREGFVAEGYVNLKGQLLQPGDSVNTKTSKFFYIRWKRTDVFSAMKMY